MITVSRGRLFAALLVAGVSAAASAKPRDLAIVELDSPPYLSGIADELSKIAIQAAHHRHRVLTPDQVRNVLGEDAPAKLAACPDAACRAALLKPLGVARAFGGSLSQNETSYVVDLWLVDVANGRLVAHLARSVLIASRRLEKDMSEAIPTMLSGREEENGELALHVSPAASLVTIDDAPVGGGTDIRRSLEPGKHRVVVQADGYLTLERWVQVVPSQIVRLDEQLIPTSGHIAEAEAETPAAAAKGAKPEEHRSFRIPVATWVTLGVSAAVFGTGLYFGLTANGLDHQAGQFDGNGVDQGLTRAQAVQGQTDAQVGNYLFIGAGVVLVAAIVIAIVTPGPPAAEAPAASPAAASALHWSFP